MIGIDTNIIIRYLTQDDPKQSPIATRFLEDTLSADAPGFISLVVLAEVVWVLVSLYGVDRAGVAEVLLGLLSTQQLRAASHKSPAARADPAGAEGKDAALGGTWPQGP